MEATRTRTRTQCRFYAWCRNELRTRDERRRGTCSLCTKPAADEQTELERIDALLSAEQRGCPLPIASETWRPGKRVERDFWPPGPLQALHAELVRGARGTGRAYEVVAQRFGVSSRTMYRHLTSEAIALDVLERLLLRAGFMLREIYPDGPETETWMPAVRREPDTDRCASPGCSARQLPDSRFCRRCLSTLHAVRDSERQRSRDFKARIRRADSRPVCCSPYCGNDRTPPARFCDDCAEAGLSEEDYE